MSAGLTQEECADRLMVDVSTVKRWESGHSTPQAWTWPRLAKLLEVTRAELEAFFEPGPSKDATATGGPVLNEDEQHHLSAALRDARRYLDQSVVGYFRRRLDACTQVDGQDGAEPALPQVLGILGAIEASTSDVPLSVLSELLSVGAQGAEFAGWLYRDAHKPDLARNWYNRATEWAQEAGNIQLQGYILLKKSQMAYDERDARRVLTFARAAQYGPWQLPSYVRVEVTQQEARGLAMTGESTNLVEQKLLDARQLFTSAVAEAEEHTQLGSQYSEATLTLRDASCYVEAGKPQRAAALYRQALATDSISRRDRGYFMARLTSSLALSGEPDEAARTGLDAIELASATKSQRTRRELARSLAAMKPWENRPGPHALREAVRSEPAG